MDVDTPIGSMYGIFTYTKTININHSWIGKYTNIPYRDGMGFWIGWWQILPPIFSCFEWEKNKKLVHFQMSCDSLKKRGPSILDFHDSGQFIINPYPNLRPFWGGIPLLNHHLGWPRRFGRYKLARWLFKKSLWLHVDNLLPPIQPVSSEVLHQLTDVLTLPVGPDNTCAARSQWKLPIPNPDNKLWVWGLRYQTHQLISTSDVGFFWAQLQNRLYASP